MHQLLSTLNHGRETYAVYYGDEYILKRPLPNHTHESKQQWLVKQHKTKDAIDAIRAVANPIYNIPKMHFINDDEFQILEERAPGLPLTAALYNSLTKRQQSEIVTSIASFLVDMNELKPAGELTSHNITDELKFARLDNFITNKMPKWFTPTEVNQMARIRDSIASFEYNTRLAWSHNDLNPGNVLYDAGTSKIYFIDFAECQYQFIYHDIFSPLQIELGLCKDVYKTYATYHNIDRYPILEPSDPKLRAIMLYRIMGVYLKRFIKASDDLRLNPQTEKSIQNNREKIEFMRTQIRNITELKSVINK